MKIVSAKFIRAAEEAKDYPGSGLSEIAFAGRSNVGKSSMINTLLGRKNLVRTSKTPGRTRKLNFFLINDRFVFVDLPGHGFAKVPLEVRRKWGPMVENYLTKRKELAGLVVIVDIRRGISEPDLNLIDFLRVHEIPVVVAATKADKLSRGRSAARERAIMKEIGENVPFVLFSSLDGRGKKELWKQIISLAG
jgi:GTP-binding protein